MTDDITREECRAWLRRVNTDPFRCDYLKNCGRAQAAREPFNVVFRQFTTEERAVLDADFVSEPSRFALERLTPMLAPTWGPEPVTQQILPAVLKDDDHG